MHVCVSYYTLVYSRNIILYEDLLNGLGLRIAAFLINLALLLKKCASLLKSEHNLHLNSTRFEKQSPLSTPTVNSNLNDDLIH
jgi:hypothetical protein